MSKRILFVAHRFGHPGGTEQSMMRYANTAVEMGYEAAVYADEIRVNADRVHSGALTNVTVTNDYNILRDKWDLIVVHGDGNTQNKVHCSDPKLLGGPIFYLLCRPEEKNQSVFHMMKLGMEHAKWVGCATSTDYKFAKKYGYGEKIRDIRGYPIECLPIITKTPEEIADRFGVTCSKVYISTGGFWPHKRFEQIAESFCKLKLLDTELILTGYDTRNGVPDYVKMGRDAGVKITPCFIYDSKAVYELMTIADLYIWNSIPGSEGFGLVLLESMYYGLPWIGTDTAAAHDMNGINGCIYQSQAEMEDLMSVPIASMGAQFDVVEQYSTRNLLELLFKVLDE